jgi:serine/threonine-protein kinase
LFLLGGIALRGLPEDEANYLLAQSKVMALLAYLALSPAGGFQRRDRVVGLLWPELDQAHARSALRKAVHLARSALGESVLVSRGDEEIGLRNDAIWCDAIELQRSAERGHLEHVRELYQGELMPGFFLTGCNDFDTWLEDRRAELHEVALAATMALAQNLEARDLRTDATREARRAARLAWNNERVFRRSLVMLDRLGDRAGALRLYDQFAKRLLRDMDAEPSPETVDLAAKLREGKPLT